MMRSRPSPYDHPPEPDLPAVTRISSRAGTARLEHRCSVCGKPITPGTRYVRELIRDDEALNPRKALVVAKYHELFFFCDNTPETVQ